MRESLQRNGRGPITVPPPPPCPTICGFARMTGRRFGAIRLCLTRIKTATLAAKPSLPTFHLSSCPSMAHSSKKACPVGAPLDRSPYSDFTTTRPALRFSNGHFTMIGLKVNDKPLLRPTASSAPTEAPGVPVDQGARRPADLALQHLQVGDHIIVGKAHRHAAHRLPAAGQAAVPDVHPAPAGAVPEA